MAVSVIMQATLVDFVSAKSHDQIEETSTRSSVIHSQQTAIDDADSQTTTIQSHQDDCDSEVQGKSLLETAIEDSKVVKNTSYLLKTKQKAYQIMNWTLNTLVLMEAGNENKLLSNKSG